MQKIKIRILRDGAKIPTKSSLESAGFDLFTSRGAIIPPSHIKDNKCVDVGRRLIPIGIAIELPTGIVGKIASRSGLSVKSNIEVGAGWIDSDYRGEIKVELKNLSSKAYRIKKGDRIAQLILIPTPQYEVEEASVLRKTKRGSAGFGSTGV